MTTADPRLWKTRKSRTRMDHAGEPAPVSVQIAGSDPRRLAEAARHQASRGAAIIDINMGCPAKKVCGAAAGSALLRDEPLVGRILDAVVRAVPVPVTLKIRTGYAHAQRNALRIARLAEAAGIAAITIHGRTRADFFEGAAEHETAGRVKAAVRIPVIVNGDIDTPQKARQVLAETGCDGVMVGRAAFGQPWLFANMAAYLATGALLPRPAPEAIRECVLGHLEAIYALYGEDMGVRIARKHLGWYARGWPGGEAFRRLAVRAERGADQLRLAGAFFSQANASRCGAQPIAA